MELYVSSFFFFSFYIRMRTLVSFLFCFVFGFLFFYIFYLNLGSYLVLYNRPSLLSRKGHSCSSMDAEGSPNFVPSGWLM